MRIKDLLIRQKDNSNGAVICADQKVTYSDLHTQVSSLSGYIRNETDKYLSIGVFIDNSIEYIEAYFAISYADKVIVPLNPKEKKHELTSAIEYCELGLIITNARNIDLLQKSIQDCAFVINVLDISTMSLVKMGRQTGAPVRSVNSELENVALMLHTSGSLSAPKRVMLTHNNLISCVEAIIKSLELKKTDRTLIALPMFLASANTSQMLAHIYLGASFVIMDGFFTPGYFFKLVETHKVTNFTGVPYMMLSLLADKKSKKYDISSLRFVCFGGAPTPVEKIKELTAAFPEIGFIHMYGQTEASTRISHLLPRDSSGRAGSVGKAIPGVELRVVDSAGKDVKTGETGEVIIKGSNVMKGYYKREEISAQVLKEGWLYTGDMGKLDSEGFLYIVGRNKNLIIRGGMNIYPEEIEEVLSLHPAVRESCVFGENNGLLGEVPIAKVILKDDRLNENEDSIKRYCFQNLAGYKVPDRVEFVSHLPKTDSGKIKRISLGGL